MTVSLRRTRDKPKEKYSHLTWLPISIIQVKRLLDKKNTKKNRAALLELGVKRFTRAEIKIWNDNHKKEE